MPLHSKKQITPLLFDTYMAMIKNSLGSKLFRNAYARIEGKKVDILDNGNLSCAFFVSSILALFSSFKLIKHPPHSTTNGTIKDLKQSGWKETKKLRSGSIILWEKLILKDDHIKSGHKHLGFYLGNKKAVSNRSKLGVPHIHHFTFGLLHGKPKRRIEKIFWNTRLEI